MKTRITAVFGLVVGVVGFTVCGEDVAVRDTVGRVMRTADTVFKPQSTSAQTLPDIGSTPIFWFDCSDTTGWTVDPATKEVTEIPSKTGNGRTLATAFSPAGNWTGWTNGAVPPTGPVFVENVAPLQGGAALDFGVKGSGRGLIFSPDPTTSANDLVGIGTVITVYDSGLSGGWLLGGGYQNEDWTTFSPTVANAKGQYYARGTMTTSDAADQYRNPLFNVNENQQHSNFSPPSAINGVFWQDGVATTPHFAGFAGRWQVLSFIPKTSNGYNYALSATGVGLGDTTSSGRSASGGMRIAEMVIYDRNLTDGERKSVEAYLAKKWFGESLVGYNGRSRIGDVRLWKSGWQQSDKPLDMTADVPSGEVLEIERLRGGHGRAASSFQEPALTKDGEGTLKIGDGSENGLDISLKKGTLAFERRSVPTSAPARPLLHLDASKADSVMTVMEGGVRYVSEWKPVEGLKWGGYDVTLDAENFITTVSARPIYVPNAMGAGLGVIDFGKAGSGRYFRYARAEARATSMKIKGPTTIIAVVGAEEGGGNITGGMGFFNRAETTVKWSTALLNAYTPHAAAHPTITPRMGKAWIDGVQDLGSDNYRYPGFHLIAFQTAGSQLTHFGGVDAATAGGLKVAEALLYDRVLTDREVADACAYLNAKWFSRSYPGYAGSADSAAAESRKVSLAGDAVIDVTGDGVASLPSLELDEHSLAKTGLGTLEVGSVDSSSGGTLELHGGTFAVAADGVTETCQMAKGAAFHLDATASNTLHGTEQDGVRYISCWHDTGFRNSAWNTQETTSLPWVTTASADLAGLSGTGLAAVDFGGTNPEKRWMNFGRSLDSIRAVFVVWRPNTEKSPLLGSSSASAETTNGNVLDFARNTSNGGLFATHGSLWPVRSGKIYRNGVSITADTVIELVWQLTEVYPAAPAHASGLCCDRASETSYGQSGSGGSRLAEVILYERDLTERERVATRNYLRRKWFGSDSEPLPEDDRPAAIASLAVAGESEIASERPLRVGALSGVSQIVKSGSAMLTVDDLSDYKGSLSVAAGTLRIAQTPPVTDGLVFRLDAGDGVETSVDTVTGVRSVERWHDLAGNGLVALPGNNGCTVKPTLLKGARAGRDAVNLSTNLCQYMYIADKSGTATKVQNVRSVFWAMDTKEGGGMLLAGGDNGYAFHRGVIYGGGGAGKIPQFQVGDPLLSGNGQAEVTAASWRVNGKAVNYYDTYVLSGGWDVISMVMRENAVNPVSVMALACDGRVVLGTGSFAYRSGGQAIGEILCYDRVLTADERLQVETYLNEKWGCAPQTGKTVGPLDVAADAKVDFDGATRHVASLSGAGDVINGTAIVDGIEPTGDLAVSGDLALADGAVWKIDFDGTQAKVLSVSGSLSFGNSLTIRLSGVTDPRAFSGLEIPVANAASFENVQNLQQATVTGLPDGVPCKLRLKNGQIVARIGGSGVVLIVR